ncbi:MAG: acyl-CoA dehydrogenase [Hyphomicrobium sp.]|nr:acyl-CoA dehydrogenase [Hyphomicrobium sp.]
MTYQPPLDDMLFVLNEICGANRISGLTGFEEATPDTIAAVLEQAATFTSEVLAPLNRTGDKVGARRTQSGVATAPGWKEAYEHFTSGGWNGVIFEHQWGGMGLPWMVGGTIQEMLNSSNMAFALCPLLTQGAIEAILLNGSDDIKATYLPKMVSGQWTGTMNLTEPQAGSDLAAVRTKAERADGHYQITGQKIFITYGDHDLTENIIHLVLARLPDAPEGVKGISLFVVPKFLPDATGAPGKANDLRCVSLEHKLGIHASPTAVMSFGDHGGAVGFLVGEENRGLEYMFVMMNQARLSVGIQGLGIAERAYQHARAYANERIQGRIVGDRTPGAKPIAWHPDVHRMLMSMRARTEAMRCLAYWAASALDYANAAPGKAERNAQQARLDFLIPIVKAWCTESACEISSLAVQVHGGMGYIEETGAAQHFRDARITTIYEGTTGIQANDLIGRKMQRDNGAAAIAVLSELKAIEAELAAAAPNDPVLESIHTSVSRTIKTMETAGRWLLEHSRQNPIAAGAAAVNLLHVFAITIAGTLLAKSALIAARQIAAEEGNAQFLKEKIAVARFFAGQIMPETGARMAAVLDAGDGALQLYPGASA